MGSGTANRTNCFFSELSVLGTCNGVDGYLFKVSKVSSYDLLFPSGSSRSYDDAEPSYRVVWMAINLGDITMANGTVKWFNATKGFGFIEPEGGKKDVFVHISALERSGLTTLADGAKVTFDIEAGRDGRESAINLSVA